MSEARPGSSETYARGMRVLVVDGANVVGSRPTGWWRDRAGAAERLHEAIAQADLDYDVVVLVLEGAGRAGWPAGEADAIHTVHARGSGDDTIVNEVRVRATAGDEVVVVTADRELRQRVAVAGGSHVGPSWLLDRIA